MNAIGKGDWVECVEDDSDVMGEIRRGAVYQVREVIPEAAFEDCNMHGPDCAQPGLDLEGQPEDEERCWCAGSFRPIYRPKAELIQSLLAAPAPTTPEPVSEPA